MSTPRVVPLGLSDLMPDECLIVSILRAWLDAGPTRAVAEYWIARRLETDPIYPALDRLFAAFDSTLGAEEDDPCPPDLVSRREEYILHQLTADHRTDPEGRELRACQAALRRARIELRPPHTIERSDQDRLLHRIAQSYQMQIRAPL